MAVVVICGSPVASPRLVNDADRQSAQESGVSALARGKATVVKLARLLEEEDACITPRRHVPVVSVTQNFAEPISRTNDVLDTIATLTREGIVVVSCSLIHAHCAATAPRQATAAI